MNNSTIQLWYDAALKQIAAESYFQQVTDLSDPSQIRPWLIRGNSPSNPLNPADEGNQFVRMVASQAIQFALDYEIVDHLANTVSGFSATLLRKKSGPDAGRYTLAFRSTEYKNWSDGGDFERDGYDGAGGELYRGAGGFALGQLRDMEWYFEQLKAGQLASGMAANGTAIANALANGATLDIVGYSLGAHLATVFTEMHPESVHQTTVFNGAGRGSINNKTGLTYGETVSQMLLRFEQILLDPNAALLKLSDQAPAVRAAILSAEPVPHRGTSGTIPGAGPNGVSIYANARYQWAVSAVAAEFRTKGFAVLKSPGLVDLDAEAQAKITQLYGHATHNDSEATANSGVHAPARSIFVEDQPEVEGMPKLPFAYKISAALKFDGDFANTHSLTLIVDSLAVMRAFMAADPDLTQRDVESIFAAASNRRAPPWVKKDAPLAAEGDSLERALDGLRKLVASQGFVATESDFGAGGFGNLSFRQPFYSNLNGLLASLAELPAVGSPPKKMTIVPLVPVNHFGANGEPLANAGEVNVLQVATRASSATDPEALAHRYALKELLPFVATGNTSLYATRYQSGELRLVSEIDSSNPSSGGGVLTTDWIDMRTQMMAAMLQRNRDNVSSVFAQTPGNWWYEDFRVGERVVAIGTQQVMPSNATPAQVEAFLRNGKTSRVVFAVDQDLVAADPRRPDGGNFDDFLFGGTAKDALRGFKGKDYLEGGADRDKLAGGDGDDTLAGGKGDDDRLEGGLGRDTYRWNVGDGTDVIVDAVESTGSNAGKRAGKISFAGAEDLSGTKTLVSLADDKLFRDVAGNRYQLLGEHGNDGILKITPATGEGGLRILGFKDEDFGIHLSTAGFNPSQLSDVQGTSVDDNFFSLDFSHGETLSAGAPNQRVLGLNGDDRIKVSWANAVARGGPGHDILLNGPDDQQLSGDEGNDILLASAGNDELDGGVGDDVLQGGVGDDYLVGGPEDVSVVSSTETDHDLIDGGPGSDVIVGGDGNDFLVGGGNLIPNAGVLTSDHTQYTYGYKRQLDGSMRIENIAGYDIAVADPFGSIGATSQFADGYFNVDGDLADFIDGGAGNDFVLAGDGDDVVLGGSGADTLVGQVGDDSVEGGTGNDTLMGDGSRGSLVLSGGVNLVYALDQFHGADTLMGNEGDDLLIGDGGSDELYGNEDNDILIGDAPADNLDIAYHGDDYLDGGSGNDFLYGYGRNDTLFGGEGDDSLEGDGAPSAVPYASHGDDYLDGEAGNDILVGGGGADQLYGGEGNDTLAGDADDVPALYQGADYLDGEAGNDVLQGYGGDDTLVAGAGDDTLAGGKGNDRYLVNLADGADTIIDGSGTNSVVFGAGITRSSLTLGQGLDPQGLGYLVIKYSESDSLSIQGGFNGIQLFEFADGKKLSPFTLYQMLASASPLPTISGGSGDDTLPTGPLSVLAQGGSGNDTYTVSPSSGWSRISDQAGASDRVLFDTSVT